MPEIDKTKCNGCGLCLDVCNCKALKVVGKKIVIMETERCGWCTECEAICPTGAITCAFEIVIEE